MDHQQQQPQQMDPARRRPLSVNDLNRRAQLGEVKIYNTTTITTTTSTSTHDSSITTTTVTNQGKWPLASYIQADFLVLDILKVIRFFLI